MFFSFRTAKIKPPQSLHQTFWASGSMWHRYVEVVSGLQVSTIQAMFFMQIVHCPHTWHCNQTIHAYVKSIRQKTKTAGRTPTGRPAVIPLPFGFIPFRHHNQGFRPCSRLPVRLVQNREAVTVCKLVRKAIRYIIANMRPIACS